MSHWIQRPVGQLAGLVLLVAMISGGMRTGEIHAHVEGDHAHDHAAPAADGLSDHDASAADGLSAHDDALAADGLSDHDDAPAANPSDTTLLHAHDVVTTVSTLPTLPTVVFTAQVSAAPIARLTTSPPPSSARIPPHRPPIA